MTNFGKRMRVAGAVGVLLSCAPAALAQGTAGEPKWMEHSRDVIQDPESHLDDETVSRLENQESDDDLLEMAEEVRDDTAAQMEQAQEDMDFGEEQWAGPALEQAQQDMREQGTKPSLDGDARRAEIYGDVDSILFISFEMPDTLLDEALRAVSEDEGTIAVLRGIKDEDGTDTLNDTMDALRERLQALDLFESNQPSVTIDPELFEDHGVSTTPTLVHVDEAGEAVATATGSVNPSWLRERVATGEQGDQGAQGETYEIGEQDLIEMLKERAQALDGDRLRQQAMDRFWGNQEMYDLAVVEEKNSYLVDPTVTIEQTIRAPDGTVIASAGDTVNPLHKVPFRRLGIVFDATDEDQIQWAQDRVQEAHDRGDVPVLMASRIDPEAGWDGYHELNDERFPNRPVYMLQPDIIDRLAIDHVPTRFEREGNKIRVTEVALDDDA